MKNNYIIMAILPFLFQNTVYSADLNAMIKTELENARKMAKIHVKLELDSVLQALVAHGKKSDANSIQAVNAIKDLKNALLQYRSEQYTSNWYDITAYFKSNPEKVSQEIDPALAKVNNALNMLQKNASIYNYKNALGLIGVVAAIGAAYGISKYRTNAADRKYRDEAQKNAKAALQSSEVMNAEYGPYGAYLNSTPNTVAQPEILTSSSLTANPYPVANHGFSYGKLDPNDYSPLATYGSFHNRADDRAASEIAEKAANKVAQKGTTQFQIAYFDAYHTAHFELGINYSTEKVQQDADKAASKAYRHYTLDTNSTYIAPWDESDFGYNNPLPGDYAQE